MPTIGEPSRTVNSDATAANLAPEVMVQCSVVNSLVTVEFDSASVNPEQFDNLKVEVTGGDSGRTFTVLAGGEASGELQSVGNTELWFNPSTVSYSISGIQNK